MYSPYKLNKQGDNIQPWHTPFPIWNQSVVPCPVLTVVSWPAYRFLKRQVRWSGIPVSKNFPQFVVIHTVKSFGIVNKTEIDVFLELSCFFNYPLDVGNLISGSSAFSKSRKRFRHLEHLEVHSSCTVEAWLGEFWALLTYEMSAILWSSEHSLSLPFFRIGMKTVLFQSCGHCWVFQICWHIECSTFTASSFRIWDSSTGIPSCSLALFVVTLPKAHLTSHSKMSGSRWVIIPSCYLAHEDLCCIVLLCILATTSS